MRFELEEFKLMPQPLMVSEQGSVSGSSLMPSHVNRHSDGENRSIATFPVRLVQPSLHPLTDCDVMNSGEGVSMLETRFLFASIQGLRVESFGFVEAVLVSVFVCQAFSSP